MKKLFIFLMLSLSAYGQSIIQNSAQWGMKCDGVTDDTQRFMNAIGTGGGSQNIYIIFVNGTCNLKSVNPITVPNYVTLDFTQQGALFLASGSTLNVNAAVIDQDYHPIFTGPGTYNLVPRNPTVCTSITGGIACSVSGSGTNPLALATSASAITRGSGASNACSVSTTVTPTSLSCTLNVNVGDFVIVGANAADADMFITDNGGNSYVIAGAIANFRAFGQLWVCKAATATATTITITDTTTNVWALSAATYVNVGGIEQVPNLINGVYTGVNSATSNSITVSRTTSYNNSLLVAAIQTAGMTTYTPSSGTTVTSALSASDTVATLLSSLTTTTPGSYTISGTGNGSVPQYQAIAIELIAATGLNASSNATNYCGSKWNGSSAVNACLPIQTSVDNKSATTALTVATPGNFTNVTNGPYLQAVVNGNSAVDEFAGLGQTGPETVAVYGGISVPATAATFEANGIMGAVNSGSATSFAVGGYFQGRAAGNNTLIFGSNSVATDNGYSVAQLFASEIDISKNDTNATSPQALSQGIRILSNGRVQPGAGIYMFGNQSNNFPRAGIALDASNETGITTNLIYLAPPDNSGTQGAIRMLNHSLAGDVFDLEDNGFVNASGYQSLLNCAQSGTNANPSVATCGSAPAGSFSCSVTASGGTCIVDTTVVTANSEIFVTQRTDTVTGTRLTQTCNTSVSTVLPVITAVTAGTSFTINLGTINTNPECFSYFIIN